MQLRFVMVALGLMVSSTGAFGGVLDAKNEAFIASKAEEVLISTEIADIDLEKNKFASADEKTIHQCFGTNVRKLFENIQNENDLRMARNQAMKPGASQTEKMIARCFDIAVDEKLMKKVLAKRGFGTDHEG